MGGTQVLLLPFWLPADVAATAWDVDTTRARELGLPSRPLHDSVADTWAWLQTADRPAPPPGRDLPGLPAELEARLLADHHGGRPARRRRCDGAVVTLHRPRVAELTDVLAVMVQWPRDGQPVPLHPGDLGWAWRLGAAAVAAAVRTWHRDGELLAVGFHDGPDVLRLAVDPAAGGDDELARAVQVALDDLPTTTDVEVRDWPAVHDRLTAAGWTPGEAWTPLVLDLAALVPDPGIEIEVVGPERAAAWTAVHQAAFGGSGVVATDRWTTMAAGPAWAGATCLLGHDRSGADVASAVVWSAGAGRPGVVEPLGVHPDHRGGGYGVAITRAAALALRSAGASQAWVATPAANVGGVATYASAGFTRLPDVRDLHRPA